MPYPTFLADRRGRRSLRGVQTVVDSSALAQNGRVGNITTTKYMVSNFALGKFQSADFALGKCKFCKPGANFAPSEVQFFALGKCSFLHPKYII